MTTEQINNNEQRIDKLFISNDLKLILDGVQDDVNTILDNDNFGKIIDFLKKNYSTSSKDELIKYFGNIFSDNTFKLMLNSYIKSIVPNLLVDDTAQDFENISFLIFLLGGLEEKNPLNDFSSYDLNLLDNLIDKLLFDIEKSEDLDDFGINFYRFVYLIEVFNKLCILNEIDESKYNIIINISLILSEKINKFLNADNKNLTKGGKNLIDNILGKLKINFSHLNLKLYNGNDIEKILDTILDSIKNQQKGYIESKNSIYGNDFEKGTFIKKIFLGNMSHLILDGLNLRLNNIDFLELKNNPKFQEVIKILSSSINEVNPSIKIEKIETIEDLKLLKTILLNIFAYIYKGDGKQINNNKNNTRDCFYDFNKDYKSDDFKIESIYNMIKFDENIEISELIELGNKLIDVGLYNNYNFENFKVKILNNIIKRFDIYYTDKQQSDFIIKLLKYIEDNKIASQLLNSYSNIYLSLSIYYSHLFDEISQKEAKDFYYNYNKISSMIVRDDELFFKNIGKYIIKEKGIKIEENYELVGYMEYENYMKQKNLENRGSIDSELSKLLNDVLTNENLLIDNSSLLKKIGEILSKNLFNSIAKVSILDKHDKNNELLLNGMEEFNINIFNGYELSFLYPKIYKKKFKDIFKKEEEYIQLNIRNLLSSHLKTKENYNEVQKSFIDKLTGLPNLARLNKDLSDMNYSISFIGLKIANLRDINSGYGYEAGDIFLKEIVSELSKIGILKGKIYRTGGAQLGIILHDEKNIENIIEKITSTEINFNNSKIKTNFFYGILKDTDSKFLEKTNMVISSIKNNGNKIRYYDEEVHKSENYKIGLSYGNELTKAIEDDRLITYYQDLICSKTGEVYKKEALMRIKREDGKIESPYMYLLAAKKYGKLVDITNKMISNIFQDVGENEGLKASINLSGDDLDNNNLLEYIENQSLINFVDNENITFEILEGGWEEGGDKFEVIKKLKDMGFKIAIDDFGAGSSGINRLNELLGKNILDYIKIDGDIVKKLISENENIANSARLDIKYIVDKASLVLDENGEKKVKVIAEFIENEEIANICIELGVDYLQGYHYSIPGQLK